MLEHPSGTTIPRLGLKADQSQSVNVWRDLLRTKGFILKDTFRTKVIQNILPYLFYNSRQFTKRATVVCEIQLLQ